MFVEFPSMARPRNGPARHFGAAPLANDNWRLPSAASALPAETRAIVEPVPTATNQGGRRRGGWRVRFRPRWGPPPDPPHRWAGGRVPLETDELRFSRHRGGAAYWPRGRLPL